jgi:hypothetical protein
MSCCLRHPPGSAAGQNPLFLQLNATSISWWQLVHWARRNPCASIPQRKYSSNSLITKSGSGYPRVLFDLALERQPVGLNQFVECCFFGFVALVVIGLGIGYRHRQRLCLQQPWPFRITLLLY